MNLQQIADDVYQSGGSGYPLPKKPTVQSSGAGWV